MAVATAKSSPPSPSASSSAIASTSRSIADAFATVVHGEYPPIVGSPEHVRVHSDIDSLSEHLRQRFESGS